MNRNPGFSVVLLGLAAALLLQAQHDFFYAGEQKQQKMFIVRKGQVVWSFTDPQGRGEISDAVLMSNGNILFAHQYGSR